jgi:PAS domain S-box-containing protein
METSAPNKKIVLLTDAESLRQDFISWGKGFKKSVEIVGISSNEHEVLEWLTKHSPVTCVVDARTDDGVGQDFFEAHCDECPEVSFILLMEESEMFQKRRLSLKQNKARCQILTLEEFHKLALSNQSAPTGSATQSGGELDHDQKLLLLESLVQQSDESILVTTNGAKSGQGYRIVYVNKAFCRMSGYAREELIGKTPKLLQGEKTDPDVLQQLEVALRDGEHFHAETINYQKDGTEYWVRWGILPIRDEHGDIQYFASVQEDITLTRKRQLHESRNHRLRSIGNLVGAVAHDLNNILSPIMLTAGMMEQDDSPEFQKKLATNLATSSKRAADIVNKLLTFSRGSEQSREIVDPQSVVNEVYAIAKETFPPTIQLDLVVENDLWPITCNATEIQQVLLNLAVNAKDSMRGKEGKLTIRCSNQKITEEEAAFLLGDAEKGLHVCLEIQDQGAGIPESELDHIFEPFHTSKDEGEGTGLGLASALGIIRGHDGGIDVVTRVGVGTTFKVYVPADPELEVKGGDTKEMTRDGSGQHILVVDDEPFIVEMICKMLEQHKYVAQGVTTPTEAVKLFAQHPDRFDAVITDLIMPEMNGIELIMKLREMNASIQILCMSGYAHHEIMEMLDQIDNQYFLNKPLKVDALLSTMYTLFENQVA